MREPAEPFDKVSSTLGDLLGKLDHIDASQDDIVGVHWITARKRRTSDKERKRQLNLFYLIFFFFSITKTKPNQIYNKI